MDTTGRENRKDRVNPAWKYIRLQEIALAFFLSWPVAMMAADMYGLRNIIFYMSVALIGIAVILFIIGQDGRQKLKEHKEG